MWVPITFFRRIVFVSIPMVLMYPWMQMQVLLFLQPWYICLYANLRPHDTQGRRRIEIFNEWVILMIAYNMALFTPFVTSVDTQFDVYGNTFLGLIGLLVLVNIGKVAWKSTTSAIQRRKLKQIRAIAQEALKVRTEKIQKKLTQKSKQMFRKEVKERRK